MNKPSALIIAPILFTAALLPSGCGEDVSPIRQVGRCIVRAASPCVAADSDALRSALAEGFSGCGGGAILLTRATYSGAFRLPPGATLMPDVDVLGEARPAFEGDGERAVFVAEGNASICGVTIDNAAPAVVAASGGALTLSGAAITVSRGAAVIAEGLDRLNLHRCDLRSGLSEATLDGLTEPLAARSAPVVGLVASRVESATIESTTIVGFAGFGAIFFETSGVWRGGGVVSGFGAGIFVEGGALHLDGLVIQGIRAAPTPTGSSGVVAVGGALLTSRDLSLSGIDGVGLFQDGARGEHFGLRALDNTEPGLWFQDVPDIKLFSTTVSGNTGAGIVALGCAGINAETTTVEETQGGDGVQLVGASGTVSLRGATLRNNARAGLLIDGTDEGASGAVTFSFGSVEITSDGAEALGAILQNTAATLDGITVDAALSTRDAQRPALPALPTLTPRPLPEVRALAEVGFIGGLINAEGQITAAAISGGALTPSP